MIIQGRGDYPQWTTKLKISYSIDGYEWFDYEDGKVFEGSKDQNTKNRINLEPFYATVVRVTIVQHHNYPCMRFGATYLLNS